MTVFPADDGPSPTDADRAASALAARLQRPPRVAVVLGSGLAAVADDLAGSTVVPYDEIPGFPAATAEGHANRLVAGRLGEVDTVFLQGRFHLYEGWSPQRVVVPVRALARNGVETLVVTNAAGGVAPGLPAGSLMLIADHLGLIFRNPLVGPVADDEQRFPDLSGCYDPELRRLALDVAGELGIRLTQGVYAAVLGPSYETPAEVRMLARLGADAIGMSTVPEVLAARALGVRVVGFSLITNAAAGLSDRKLTHEEVLAVGRAAGGRLGQILRALIPRIPPNPVPGADR